MKMENKIHNTDNKALQSVIWAKAFYNAYIALEQTKQECPFEIMIDVPVIVNGCFSIELSIKALLINSGIQYDKEHNIYILFSLLPDSIQFEVLDYLLTKAPEYREEGKVLDELLLISNAFVDWRYSFEGTLAPAVDSRFISAFANALCWTLLAHYNVKIEKVDDDLKSDEEIDLMFEENRRMCKDRNLSIIGKKLL